VEIAERPTAAHEERPGPAGGARTALGTRIDAVVVSYRSRDTLRACVAPLAAIDDVSVIVVDNASPDAALDTVRDLPVECVQAGHNGGFAAACNIGIARGSAPFVLLINPDATIAPADLAALVAALEPDHEAGLAAPRILDGSGAVAPSLRRFPRLRSTYAQALFLHRLWPRARWTDEVIRDPYAYERPGSPEWVSGACMLIRRTALERSGGLDAGFFLYCEDTELCARLRRNGFRIRYEPRATVRHAEGTSAPRGEMLPVLARSRIRYARLHASRAIALLETLGVALGAATHALACVRRPALRRGHLASLRIALRATAGGA
jgi:GT2 family glycosyltransferase